MKSNCASQSRLFVDRAPSALLPHAAPKALLLSARHKHQCLSNRVVCKCCWCSGCWPTPPADWAMGICRSHPSSLFLLPQMGQGTPSSSLHARSCGQPVSNRFTSSTGHKQLYADAESFKLRPKPPNHMKV